MAKEGLRVEVCLDVDVVSFAVFSFFFYSSYKKFRLGVVKLENKIKIKTYLFMCHHIALG